MLVLEETPLYTLNKYITPTNEFDYEEYCDAQNVMTMSKPTRVWTCEENIQFIANYIKSRIEPKFGVCHGTRTGAEQQWFMKHIHGCDVIGTEISEVADTAPNTIKWDFHKVKPEWIDAVDFIYTNSFDHTYNPEECLNAWISCLRRNGLCIIEYVDYKEGIIDHTAADAFRTTLQFLPYLVLMWADGRYGVTRIVNTPKMKNGTLYQVMVVIERFR